MIVPVVPSNYHHHHHQVTLVPASQPTTNMGSKMSITTQVLPGNSSSNQNINYVLIPSPNLQADQHQQQYTPSNYYPAAMGYGSFQQQGVPTQTQQSHQQQTPPPSPTFGNVTAALQFKGKVLNPTPNHKRLAFRPTKLKLNKPWNPTAVGRTSTSVPNTPVTPLSPISMVSSPASVSSAITDRNFTHFSFDFGPSGPAGHMPQQQAHQLYGRTLMQTPGYTPTPVTPLSPVAMPPSPAPLSSTVTDHRNLTHFNFDFGPSGPPACLVTQPQQQYNSSVVPSPSYTTAAVPSPTHHQQQLQNSPFMHHCDQQAVVCQQLQQLSIASNAAINTSSAAACIPNYAVNNLTANLNLQNNHLAGAAGAASSLNQGKINHLSLPRRIHLPPTSDGTAAFEILVPSPASISSPAVTSPRIISPKIPTANNNSSASSTLPVKKKSKFKFCAFCKENGEAKHVYRGHSLKEGSTVSCPILRGHVCGFCGATGDNAHTNSYCPKNPRKGQSIQRKLTDTPTMSSGRKRGQTTATVTMEKNDDDSNKDKKSGSNNKDTASSQQEQLSSFNTRKNHKHLQVQLPLV